MMWDLQEKACLQVCDQKQVFENDKVACELFLNILIILHKLFITLLLMSKPISVLAI